MGIRLTLRLGAVALATLAAAAVTTTIGSAAAKRFFDDDPIWVEKSTQDASAIKSTELNLFIDLTSNILTGGAIAQPGRAKNVNTVDEVPNSSWFTNRIGTLPLTPKDIATGPDTTAGPAAGPWTVTSSKSDGVTPGFTIKDSTGQRWFLKFDPPGHRGMATGTEVAATKLMWALGYNVPENHVAYLHREQLVVGKEAKFTPAGGAARPMRAGDIDGLLARADREHDGSYRVVASKALQGTPVGRIRFSGVRPDDPNDLVPHEDRRELRGYRVFAAWLNHVDAKSINSLDTLVRENGRAYVKHHLLDFGSVLGSGGIGAADYWEGHQYLVDPRRAGIQMVAFGFAAPKWTHTRFYESPTIGRVDADPSQFDPEQWKPRVPNQAFLHARGDDTFWAARRVMAITTPMIRAAVHAGQFDDPQSEEMLVRTLVERRNAIGRAYLIAINPIVDPAIGPTSELTFSNAAVDADVARAPRGYRAAWSTYDNTTGETIRIGETSSRTTAVAVPHGLPTADGAFIEVSLSAVGAPDASWEKPVSAFFRLRNGSWKLVGFERMPESARGESAASSRRSVAAAAAWSDAPVISNASN